MKFPFLLGLHNHQPFNNFSNVVDEAVNKSYYPFMEAAVKYPSFKFAVHYSGWLLEYIITYHKNLFKLLKKGVANGQIEFFGGGYYEPVLASIPSNDRTGQIKKLSSFIENHFGQKPTGLWLTERVWDSSIIPSLSECGITDVIVDDYHFISAGYNEAAVKGYFRTEYDGSFVNLFPIDQRLRYIIPFSRPQEVVTEILNGRDEGKSFLTCFDDGEKFGLWPETYEWVYTKKWLEEFIEILDDNDDIHTCHFNEIVKITKPSGMAYLPVTSYHEMGEWSLFTDAQIKFKALEKFLSTTGFAESKCFVKGGIWKNFLAKYPEANRIHKRSLKLSRLNRELKDKGLYDAEFEEFLYKSQCNDCLWHGLFGGLYLPNLRDNAWYAIINAEKQYEKLLKVNYPLWTIEDSDLDGYDEVYLRTDKYNMQFIALDGGQLATIELKEPAFNFLNTLARRKEGYHELFNENEKVEDSSDLSNDAESTAKSIHEKSLNISSELRNSIYYDWYNKNSFIDHFVEFYSPEEFYKGEFLEKGDFANQPFEAVLLPDGCEFTRKGGLYLSGGNSNAVMVKKYTYNDGLSCRTSFTSKEECYYVQEFNFHFADIENILINNNLFKKNLNLKGKKITIIDKYSKCEVSLTWDTEADIFVYPVNTVSLAVDEFELTTQGICITAAFKFNNSFEINARLLIG